MKLQELQKITLIGTAHILKNNIYKNTKIDLTGQQIFRALSLLDPEGTRCLDKYKYSEIYEHNNYLDTAVGQVGVLVCHGDMDALTPRVWGGTFGTC